MPVSIVEEWTRVGLAVGPADRPRAERAVADAYRAVGLTPPEEFVWVRSPREGLVVAACLRSGRARAQLRRRLPSGRLPRRAGRLVRDTLLAEVRSHVRRGMPRFAFLPTFESLSSPDVHEAVWERVGAPVSDAALADVDSHFAWSPRLMQIAGGCVCVGLLTSWVAGLAGTVGGFNVAAVTFLVAVCASIALFLASRILARPRWILPVSWEVPFFTGQFSAGMLAYFANAAECPPEPIPALMEVARHAGWWWPFARVAVICERPTRLERDERGRLHSATGPAVEYPDGWQVWAWHGTRVPRRAIEDAARLRWRDVVAEREIAVRRALLERYGFDRVAREGRFEVVDEDRDARGRPRRLLRLTLPDDEPLVVVEVVNATAEPDGTHRTFHLRVPPQARTAAEAVAWTFGLTPTEYRPLQET